VINSLYVFEIFALSPSRSFFPEIKGFLFPEVPVVTWALLVDLAVVSGLERNLFLAMVMRFNNKVSLGFGMFIQGQGI